LFPVWLRRQCEILQKTLCIEHPARKNRGRVPVRANSCLLKTTLQSTFNSSSNEAAASFAQTIGSIEDIISFAPQAAKVFKVIAHFQQMNAGQ